MSDERPAAESSPMSPVGTPTWHVSAAWTYAAVLVLAMLALAFGWGVVERALDVRRLFR